MLKIVALLALLVAPMVSAAEEKGMELRLQLPGVAYDFGRDDIASNDRFGVEVDFADVFGLTASAQVGRSKVAARHVWDGGLGLRKEVSLGGDFHAHAGGLLLLTHKGDEDFKADPLLRAGVGYQNVTLRIQGRPNLGDGMNRRLEAMVDVTMLKW
jgi:hypothetical protein